MRLSPYVAYIFYDICINLYLNHVKKVWGWIFPHLILSGKIPVFSGQLGVEEHQLD
jgi:hypothetical protein